MVEIRQWTDIEERVSGGGLILGNGASISVDPIFTYKSLYNEAATSGILTEGHQAIFQAFDTTDFETVLRRIWYTRSVNSALKISEQITTEAYHSIRTALVQTVREHHSSHGDVVGRLSAIQKFLRKFTDVLSLNFDLILYWAILESRDTDSRDGYTGSWVKDCFTTKKRLGSHTAMMTNSSQWTKFTEPYGNVPGATRVFYPHGNLCFITDDKQNTYKAVVKNYSFSQIVDVIVEHWETDGLHPLFICEGDSEEKLRFILSVPYLTAVYQQIIPNIKNALTIYGWSMSKADLHILDQVGRVENKENFQIGVSVFGNDRVYIGEATSRLEERGFKRENIHFFDSESPGCWCHEAQELETESDEYDF